MEEDRAAQRAKETMETSTKQEERSVIDCGEKKNNTDKESKSKWLIF